jgi:GH15 family glucan-1,4-alpha-glucosidase
MFCEVLKHANHLGLFSEGMDFESKRHLGNFPQGYSHLALIDTAMTLSKKRVEEEDKLLEVLRTQKLE